MRQHTDTPLPLLGTRGGRMAIAQGLAQESAQDSAQAPLPGLRQRDGLNADGSVCCPATDVATTGPTP